MTDARLQGNQSKSRQLESKLDVLGQEPPKIYQEAITKVKDTLGDQAFAKISEYVYHRDGRPRPTRIITYVGPAEQNNPDGPDARRVQAVHP